MKTQGCPLCKKAVHSNVAASEFCALCAMPLEQSHTIVWKQDDETFKFCSSHCLQQFKQEAHA